MAIQDDSAGDELVNSLLTPSEKTAKNLHIQTYCTLLVKRPLWICLGQELRTVALANL